MAGMCGVFGRGVKEMGLEAPYPAELKRERRPTLARWDWAAIPSPVAEDRDTLSQKTGRGRRRRRGLSDTSVATGREYLHRCAVRSKKWNAVRRCRCAATSGYSTPPLRGEERRGFGLKGWCGGEKTPRESGHPPGVDVTLYTYRRYGTTHSLRAANAWWHPDLESGHPPVCLERLSPLNSSCSRCQSMSPVPAVPRVAGQVR